MGLMFTSWEFAWRHLIFSLVVLDNDNVEDLPEDGLWLDVLGLDQLCQACLVLVHAWAAARD